LHGHNWKIEVAIAGDELDPAGVLLDFGVLKERVRGIVERLDHRFLNELDPFAGGQPSSERIAAFIARELERALREPGLRVSRVSAWESEDACATYIPPTRASRVKARPRPGRRRAPASARRAPRG
ncbi:MAG: 6-carboxytetrahydropterin synthase, partial [Desulfobacterales bacterium]